MQEIIILNQLPEKFWPLTKDCDLNSLALGNAVVLQFDKARCCHLYGAKYSHHFKNTVIKTWCKETVIFLCTTPKIGPAHETETEK